VEGHRLNTAAATRFVPARIRPLAKRTARRLTRPTYRRTLALVIDRDELPEVLNRRGLLGTGVEVGVRKGEFSERILSSWSGERLISVDAWSTRSDPDESAAGVRFGLGPAPGG
jgi:hypothetical protein